MAMPGPGAAVLVVNAADMIPRFPLMRSSGTGKPDPATFFATVLSVVEKSIFPGPGVMPPTSRATLLR